MQHALRAALLLSHRAAALCPHDAPRCNLGALRRQPAARAAPQTFACKASARALPSRAGGLWMGTTRGSTTRALSSPGAMAAAQTAVADTTPDGALLHRREGLGYESVMSNSRERIFECSVLLGDEVSQGQRVFI
jgi:hypothetical protein